MYYFYIVRCADNTLYSGQTTDLKRRVKEHNSGSAVSARYTRFRKPVKLVYFEEYETLSEALKREWAVKKMPKKKKEELIKEIR